METSKEFPLLLTVKEARVVAAMLLHYVNHHSGYTDAMNALNQEKKIFEAIENHIKATPGHPQEVIDALEAARKRIAKAQKFIDEGEAPLFVTFKNVFTKLHVFKVEHNLEFTYENDEKVLLDDGK